jgi:hypothetical protein
LATDETRIEHGSEPEMGGIQIRVSSVFHPWLTQIFLLLAFDARSGERGYGRLRISQQNSNLG